MYWRGDVILPLNYKQLLLLLLKAPATFIIITTFRRQQLANTIALFKPIVSMCIHTHTFHSYFLNSNQFPDSIYPSSTSSNYHRHYKTMPYQSIECNNGNQIQDKLTDDVGGREKERERRDDG